MDSNKLDLATYKSIIDDEDRSSVPKIPMSVGKKKMLIKRLRCPSSSGKKEKTRELVTTASTHGANRLEETRLNNNEKTRKLEKSFGCLSKPTSLSSQVSDLLDMDHLLTEVGVDEKTRRNFYKNMQILVDKMESTMKELFAKPKRNNKFKPTDKKGFSDVVGVDSTDTVGLTDEQGVTDRPDFLYRVFNDMVFDMLDRMSLSDPEAVYREHEVARDKPFDAESLEKRRVNSLESVEHIRNTKALWKRQIASHGERWLLRMWNLSVETCVDEKLLYDVGNNDCYLVPSFSFFDSLYLHKWWDVLSLKQKSDIWKTLRQMQTLYDLIDIVPEELIVGLLRLADDLTNVKMGQGVTELDAFTFMMLKNHLVFSGVGKFAIMVVNSLSNKPTLVTAPSFQNLLQKAQSY